MSANTMQLATFSYLLSKVQDRNFRDTRTDLPDVLSEYTREGDTSNSDYRDSTTVGLGQWGVTSEFGQFNKDAFEPGTERVSTWVKLTQGIVVSEELLMDMEKNDRVYQDKVKMLKNVNKEFKDTWQWTKEVICSQFISQMTVTTKGTTWPGSGRDGLALASAAHTSIKNPPVTVTNLQTASTLNQLAIEEAITMLENQVDDAGRPQGPVTRVGLLHGRWWDWRVAEILGTERQLDTANWNINPLVNKASKKRCEIVPILIPYLSSTSTKWAVIDLKYHQLTRFQALDATFSRERDISTGAVIFKATGRFGIDHLSWRGYNANLGL